MKGKPIQPMKLEKFISETLLQVINGVEEAQEALRVKGSTAKINPEIYDPKKTAEIHAYGGSSIKVIPVKFDVSVTVEDEKETGADIGIVVGSIRLGALGKSGESNNVFSRIQFEIPVTFPEGHY